MRYQDYQILHNTGAATPGEYAKAKSLCVAIGLVALISILPGLPSEWKT